MQKFVIIDSLALIHRAFHILPPLTDKKGRQTNALYGFTSILLKILKDLKPDFIAAAFDLPSPTFRDKIFTDYKAHRPKTPEALTSQIALVKEMLEAFNIKILEKEGYEADDIIGSLSKWLNENYEDVECIIVTGDLDTLQLISPKTKVYTLKKGISQTAIYGIKEVKERFNLEPWQLADYKALLGDQSDNIPGVKGIGAKTAQQLISKFNSIDQIYKNLDSKEISPKIKKLLKSQKQEAFFSKELSLIYKDIPIKEKIEDFKFGNFDKNKILNKLLEFGFKSLLSRLSFLNINDNVLSKDNNLDLKTLEVPLQLEEVKDEFISSFLNKSKEIFIDKSNFKDVDSNHIIVANAHQAYKIPVDKFVDNNVDIMVIGYDLKEILKQFPLLIDKLKNIFDIKIAAWLIDPDKRDFSFKKLCQKYNLFVNEDEEITLSQKIALGFKLKKILFDELTSLNLLKVYQEIEAPLIAILALMELRGIKINQEKFKELSQLINSEINKLQNEIYNLAQSEFNINSPKQLSFILFEKLKLPSDQIIKTPKGAISTDETELKKLIGIHPIIEKILFFRELSKLKNTYIDILPTYIDKNSRIHTNFDQTGTATGRLSSMEPNLQNIPVRTDWGKKVREAFEAEEGYNFVSFDFSQMELRLMAHFSKDEHLIKAFLDGKDIHTITAAKVHNIKEQEVTPEQRRQAKTLNFGILYGLSAFGLSQATGMSRQEAKNFIKNYFAQFPGVDSYIKTAKAQAEQKGYVETLFGRKRFLPALKNAGFRARLQAEREAINAPLQGTVADIMKMAMIKVSHFLKNYPKDTCFLILQIHDDLLFEIKEQLIKEVAPKIKEIMENIYKLDVPLKVDVKIGKNWGELYEFTPYINSNT